MKLRIACSLAASVSLSRGADQAETAALLQAKSLSAGLLDDVVNPTFQDDMVDDQIAEEDQELQHSKLQFLQLEDLLNSSADVNCQPHCEVHGCEVTKKHICPWKEFSDSMIRDNKGWNGARHADDGGAAFKCCCVHRTSESEPCGGATSAGAGDGKVTNLVILFDGTWNFFDKRRTWPTGSTEHAESNIAQMYRLLPSDAGQLVYYEQGVGSPGVKNDDGNSGIGVAHHFHNAFEWLAKKYAQIPGKKRIFIFGFSRGALSARMMQGAINRVGIPKPGYFKDGIVAVGPNDVQANAFKNSETKSFGAQPVEFVGLFDGVLRTLLKVDQRSMVAHHNVKNYYMKMTSVVKNFRHAIALDDYREIFQANELRVHDDTNVQQVWFMGAHGDVGTRGKQSNIALGWMLDEAVAAHLQMPANWRNDVKLAVDYLADLNTEAGIEGAHGSRAHGMLLDKVFSMTTVRNPWRCAESRNVKLHKSVEDRMVGLQGWVPQQYCCSALKAKMSSSITYVSNTHYNTAKQNFQATSRPHWIKVTVEKLIHAPVWETFGNPDYRFMITGWHSLTPKPDGKVVGAGCCHQQKFKPTAAPKLWCASRCSWWQKRVSQWLGNQDINEELILAYEPHDADQFVVEVIEEDTFMNDYIGRAVVDLTKATPGHMTDYVIRTAKHGKKQAKLRLKFEFLNSDKAAVAPLKTELSQLRTTGTEDHAQCLWLALQLGGKTQDDYCKVTSAAIAKLAGMGSAGDCKGFLEDATWGL